jgi:hypothetical protein
MRTDAAAAVSTCGVTISHDQPRPSRTVTTRRPTTPTNQRGGLHTKPLPTPASVEHTSAAAESVLYHHSLLRSPDAFEMARVHTTNIDSHVLATPASIFQSFLSPHSLHDTMGPVIPDGAEEQCGSSSLDADIDTQLHQLQLRLAATRDMLRASAQPQVVAQDARRRAAKGQQGGSGGLMRYSVSSDIKKKVAASNAADANGFVESTSNWAPPKLEMKFPWDDEKTAADRQPSADAEPAVRGASTVAAAPSQRLQGAYHRYFGAQQGGIAASVRTSDAGSELPRSATMAATGRGGGREAKRPPSAGSAGMVLFNPQHYAQSILRRQQQRLGSTKTDREEDIYDSTRGSHSIHAATPLAKSKKLRTMTLLSPPRDEDQRHQSDEDEKCFDDDDYDFILQPALNRSGLTASHLTAAPADTAFYRQHERDLVSTPRGAQARTPQLRTSPVHGQQKHAVVLEAPHHDMTNTQVLANHYGSVAESWSASVASVLESINFANSAHPVMVPTTFLSGWSSSGGGAGPSSSHHRSASVRDEGEYVMARDVMTMLRH